MNSHTTLLVFFVLFRLVVYGQTPSLQRTLRLPANAQAAIFSQFGNWKYADISIPVYSSSGKETGQEYADLIKGDFNGDHRTDYAGIFQLLDSAEAPLLLISLLCHDSSYICQAIDKGMRDIPTIVHLVKKGTVETDMETGKSYKHPYDAIGWYYYEKAGGTYYFRDGQFQYITTSD